MTDPDDLILVTRGLTKEFGGLAAVSDVDLRIRRGSIHAMIGPNGAGKTTCFNLLTKFLPPSRGSIVFDGKDITHDRPDEIARRGLVRSFQISAVFPELSALTNVRIALQRKRGGSFDFWRSEEQLRPLNEAALQLLEAVGLAHVATVAAGELAYGQKRALELATTLALDPKMLLLDEPMAGIGREDFRRIEALIRTAAANRTVLMVEHNLSIVASLSDRITVLARGRVLADGDYGTVAKDPAVIEAYIGSGRHG
ncbi:ABC transporter ATP-binding protein [Bradyrhizobium sp. LHD-71]|uniref:ABC transporter ATP-binding protein n=1 Tax=Bradyrhizobium sp. LHD-71 TaxID=3072141 RepID=UPI00280D0087|nr:ABC transporter ATP-binding protein [Bradyrhizobium sp. LHD-71]MDQ8727977.1 ABC transporter ATP-binding protein [Bradyrhizobium sp. LHD-71]